MAQSKLLFKDIFKNKKQPTLNWKKLQVEYSAGNAHAFRQMKNLQIVKETN